MTRKKPNPRKWRGKFRKIRTSETRCPRTPSSYHHLCFSSTVQGQFSSQVRNFIKNTPRDRADKAPDSGRQLRMVSKDKSQGVKKGFPSCPQGCRSAPPEPANDRRICTSFRAAEAGSRRRSTHLPILQAAGRRRPRCPRTTPGRP